MLFDSRAAPACYTPIAAVEWEEEEVVCGGGRL